MIQSNENNNNTGLPAVVLIAAGEPAAVKLALIRGILKSLLEYIHRQGYEFDGGDGNPPLEFMETNKHAPKAAADLIHQLFCITMAEELVKGNGKVVFNKANIDATLDAALNTIEQLDPARN